ncbi:peptidoglycan DD-metalloendopeptidase family protein [Snodgrassella alvi]|jgi:lipoprotein NlpD|uniref:Peptidoglycan-binding protein LysM n=1 Tax=Snodgrassella alvi TaxID=1196083 RepID=A0A855FN56_9NEIS|nr:peptidoglycan DD-metalloendopeptidase family protein [Snodgrassella alvi]PIT10563.1 peptidoglycan-binding protein LysM [Snodgrassella alvi]PIT25273.1 peptidoglycan-binding protein LysM [Snodgrassella alvi]PIT25717.1 peptidoglycan-binding protein LysM [Snodgrassella alvi]PIT27317.1 peptidoglycan-binding protein LysM [Snodgrassella alvi]PIT47440.1 peptidoglycan-binding protein LysM [Snodgrassella alvi]
MLKKNVIRSGWCLLVLALSACTLFKQPAAPTETGSSEAGTAATTADNPYGAAPPYTPPANSAPAYTPNTGTSTGYVGNYSPVDINAATHTVERGDTVFNISKRYQITQDNLRSWNNIVDNNIKLGQVLRVKPAGYVAPSGSRNTTKTVTAPVNTPNATTTTSTTTTTTPSSSTTVSTSKTVSTGGVRSVSGIEWQRPTAGSILQSYGGSSKGIDYGGSAGQSVVAAASGKVVYAGNGLRGYGNLIIVQHNQTYLTAYGNNQSILVKEGQQVKRGQQIATMGNTDAKRTQLHFELRENGQPQDPSRFLPM